jgi:hypothetical protein
MYNQFAKHSHILDAVKCQARSSNSLSLIRIKTIAKKLLLWYEESDLESTLLCIISHDYETIYMNYAIAKLKASN